MAVVTVMPFRSERANRLGHVPIVNNQRVQDAFSRWAIQHTTAKSRDELADLAIPLEDLSEEQEQGSAKYALTVDGSDTEVEATREYPTIKVGYVRIAAGLVDIEQLRESGKSEFVDPRKLRQAHQHAAFDGAFPGAGLAAAGKTGRDTWREEVNRFLFESRIDDTSRLTLADMLLEIHRESLESEEWVTLGTCPNCGAKSREASLLVGLNPSKCSSCQSPLFLADLLRTHEEFSEEGSNIGPLTRLMNVSERLATAGYIKILSEDRHGLSIINQALFITDGPLALFGPVAPLKRQFQAFISGIQTQYQGLGMHLPLLVGIEKSGAMVEHAEQISQSLPPRTVLPLSTEYINRVTGRPFHNNYGVDEFYGRRFIYKTTADDTLVITVPPIDGRAPYGHAGLESPSHYPNLKRVCETLDSIRTRLYDNAVIPLALAHSAASLPLGVGESVLRYFAQKGLGIQESALTRNHRGWRQY